MRAETEIRAQLNAIREVLSRRSPAWPAPGLSFEDRRGLHSVEGALAWVLGDDDEAPLMGNTVRPPATMNVVELDERQLAGLACAACGIDACFEPMIPVHTGTLTLFICESHQRAEVA